MTKGNPIDYLKQTAREKKLLELALKGAGLTDENTGAQLKLWTGTQEEYDAIEEPQDTTIYIIVEETEV